MEIDLIRSVEAEGKRITYTDVCAADGVQGFDLLVPAATNRKRADISLLAAKMQTIFIGSNQPVTISTNGTSAVQTVTISGGVSGGTFTLTLGGYTTTAIPWNASAAVVQAALQALTSIGTNNALVTGSDGGPWVVTFAGSLAVSSVATMTYSTASLTGGVPAIAVVATTAGVAPTQTFSFPGNAAMEWALQDGFFAIPFSSNISAFNVTNAQAVQAKVVFRFGMNI